MALWKNQYVQSRTIQENYTSIANFVNHKPDGET